MTGLPDSEPRKEGGGEGGTIEDVVAGLRQKPLILSEGDIERAVRFKDIPCAFGQVVEDHVRRVIGSYPGMTLIGPGHDVFSPAKGGRKVRRRWVSKEVDGRVLSCGVSKYMKNMMEISRVWHHPERQRRCWFTPLCEMDVLYESPSAYGFCEVKCVFSTVIQNINEQMTEFLDRSSMARRCLPRFLGNDKPLEGMFLVNRELLESADLGKYRSSGWDDVWTGYLAELDRQGVRIVTLNMGLNDYIAYCERVIDVCPSAVSSIEMKSLRVRLDRYIGGLG